MKKEAILKMLNDCIEWAELTCDDISIGDFFEMLDIRNQSTEYCLMINEMSKEGVFDEK